jgi:hypothetical protein
MRILTLLGLIVGALFTNPAPARDNGQWDATDADVAKWFRDLKQPDAPNLSCCGEADAYYADSFEVSKDGEYIAIITDERDDAKLRRPHIKIGTRIIVPYNKLKFDDGNPTGHGVIFVGWDSEDEGYWRVLCYITPGMI